MKFAKRLKKIREDKKLNQSELGEISNLAPSAISQFESNLREPSATSLIKLSKALNISADYLLGLKNEKNS